jgi:hypothetical protein
MNEYRFVQCNMYKVHGPEIKFDLHTWYSKIYC